MFCFAPLIAVGALIYSVETSWHTQESLVGPYVQVQTCSRGLGSYMKGNHEWVAGGIQYAPHVELGRGFSLSFLFREEVAIAIRSTRRPECDRSRSFMQASESCCAISSTLCSSSTITCRTEEGSIRQTPVKITLGFKWGINSTKGGARWMRMTHWHQRDGL